MAVCVHDPDDPADPSAERPFSVGEVFDEVSVLLGSTLARRQAIGMALKLVGGAALVGLGLRPAEAARPRYCRCNGVPLPTGQACCKRVGHVEVPYNPMEECCTRIGVVPKKLDLPNHPIQELSLCPNRVSDPDHVPSADGPKNVCTLSPDFFLGADFQACCREHDLAYTTCQPERDPARAQRRVDDVVYRCLAGVCRSTFRSLDPRRGLCLGGADTAREVLRAGGHLLFIPSQREACLCCPDAAPCCPEGQVCDERGRCVPQGEGWPSQYEVEFTETLELTRRHYSTHTTGGTHERQESERQVSSGRGRFAYAETADGFAHYVLTEGLWDMNDGSDITEVHCNPLRIPRCCTQHSSTEIDSSRIGPAALGGSMGVLSPELWPSTDTGVVIDIYGLAERRFVTDAGCGDGTPWERISIDNYSAPLRGASVRRSRGRRFIEAGFSYDELEEQPWESWHETYSLQIVLRAVS